MKPYLYAAQDETLLRMRNEEGLKFHTIGKRLGRSKDSVLGRYWRLKNLKAPRSKAAPASEGVLAMLPATLSEITAAGFNASIPKRLCTSGRAIRFLIPHARWIGVNSFYIYLRAGTPIASNVQLPKQ